MHEWQSMLACADEHAVTVRELAAHRSSWSAAAQHITATCCAARCRAAGSAARAAGLHTTTPRRAQPRKHNSCCSTASAAAPSRACSLPAAAAAMAEHVAAGDRAFVDEEFEEALVHYTKASGGLQWRRRRAA